MRKIKNKGLVITVSVILVLALIIGIIAILPKEAIDRTVITENAPQKTEATYQEGSFDFVPDEFTVVGKEGDLELLYNSTDLTMKVVNTKTGYEWKSFVTDEEYIHNADKGNTENSDRIRKKLSRLFDVGYTNFIEVNSTSSVNDDDCLEVNYSKLKNGIAIEAKFDTGITVVMEMWLENGGLNVRIPRDKIKEEEGYGISLVTVLPMFGATTDDYTDGFVLFPDASGGIYNIKEPVVRQAQLSTDVYFPANFSLDDIESNNRQGQKNATMPFFGLSKGKNAYVGYITEGEMNGTISLDPSGVVYDLNRICSSVSYRKSYSYINPAGQVIVELEKKISANDFGVFYSFIGAETEEPITYGDMARTLRAFLVKTGRLVKTESSKNETVKVNLQMLMTTKVESMLGKYLQAMTTCEDIENLVESFDKEDRDTLRVMLLGWQSTGYNIYPSSSKIAKNIGNLKELCNYLKENKVEHYTVEDYIFATTEAPGFSKQNDAVYNEIFLPVTNSDADQYVRNVYRGYKQLAEKDIPYLAKRNVGGIALDKVAWYVFDDFQKNLETTRYDVVSLYKAMFNTVKEAGMNIASQRGNAYALDTIDYIYDVVEKGSSYKMIDKEVPFYEMVVHGYIPYSLDTPGNMAVNYETQKLKWIEYGAEPTFLLTQEMSEKFKDSKVENAFATELDNWLEEIERIREEFNTTLAFTANNTIEDHSREAVSVYSVTYSNGKKIYINYRNQKATVDGIEIPEKDYVIVDANSVVEGGENNG